jgi:DDE family transposase
MKTLFNGELQSVLDDQKISEVLRDVSVAELSDEDVVVALHDPCDIRKGYSEKLENLGIVRDLKGNFINGFNTFNTVCVNGDGKRLHLSDITVYSNGDKAHYVKQTELDALVQKQVKSIKQKEPVELTERERGILQLLEEDELVNLGQVTRNQLQAISQQFKEANPKIAVWHVLDRQFDGLPLFEFIKYDLNDTFVIRLKISRNSNERSVNEEGKTVAVKLKDAALSDKQVEILDKVRIKKKVYQQVKRVIEWGTLILEGETYYVVRVTLLKRDGRPIFKQPMLLLTNHPVEAQQEALSIYRLYLMRSKIEEVFKFVKSAVGWEQFQVRDWESIKNLIATAFFIGGYFYKIEPHLANHPVVEWLCQLGNGKGKVTRHFFLEGLKSLLTHHHVEQIRQQTNLTVPEWEAISAFVP